MLSATAPTTSGTARAPWHPLLDDHCTRQPPNKENPTQIHHSMGPVTWCGVVCTTTRAPHSRKKRMCVIVCVRKMPTPSLTQPGQKHTTPLSQQLQRSNPHTKHGSCPKNQGSKRKGLHSRAILVMSSNFMAMVVNDLMPLASLNHTLQASLSLLCVASTSTQKHTTPHKGGKHTHTRKEQTHRDTTTTTKTQTQLIFEFPTHSPPQETMPHPHTEKGNRDTEGRAEEAQTTITAHTAILPHDAVCLHTRPTRMSSPPQPPTHHTKKISAAHPQQRHRHRDQHSQTHLKGDTGAGKDTHREDTHREDTHTEQETQRERRLTRSSFVWGWMWWFAWVRSRIRMEPLGP